MIPLDGKYGEIKDEQVLGIRRSLQKAIFFLLLYVDPETKDNYDVNIEQAFFDIQNRLCGLNELFNYSSELIITMSFLERALQVYKSGGEFSVYRKLILDAGAEVMKIGDDRND